MMYTMGSKLFDLTNWRGNVTAWRIKGGIKVLQLKRSVIGPRAAPGLFSRAESRQRGRSEHDRRESR